MGQLVVHNSRAVTFWVIFGILLLVIVSCDDDDNPFGPGRPGDFSVYVYEDAYGLNRYWEYHTGSGVFDSFNLQVSPYGTMSISSDGSRLYLTRPDKVAVVDIASREVVDELPFPGIASIVPSSDGRYLALGDAVDEHLYLLKLPDYTVLFHDSFGAYGGDFCRGSTVFYTYDRSANPVTRPLYRLEIGNDSFSVSRRVFDEGRVYKAVPSPDGTRVFMFVGFGGSDCYFACYDPRSDSVIFMDRRFAAPGALVVTADGNRVYYTTPPSFFGGSTIYPNVFVYNVRENRLEDQIETYYYHEGATHNDTLHYPPSHMVITPDDRMLVGLVPHEPGYLLAIDAVRKKVVDQKGPTDQGGYRSLVTSN